MKKTIMDSLPETFKQLQRDRQQAMARITTLEGKLNEHRQRVAEAANQIKMLEGEIAEIVSAGGDPAGQLRKLRSLRDGLGDLQNVVSLAEGAVATAQAEADRIQKELGKALQTVVIECRNKVAEGLHAEITAIEGRVNEWRTTVFTVAEELGLPAPSSGDEIALRDLR